MQIAIDDKCKEVFKQLKFEKLHRYIIYKIEGEKIVVEQHGERNETWDQFLHRLPKDDYRFGVYDLEFKTHDGINSTKIFFCNWLTEHAKIKSKMLYATGKEAFKK
ncbi:hypothetical protein DAPPUDRAFT_70036 [Daphnia pulex]|uniref:ADF-H domain-containing protein n=1 Tax=Daphnia pulex TaxID=6669 RepID=E9I414_DAPPU|nr:hypothetical protein DAPPUDRAFT_70036 [Daphnia pulex]|eukprot:EFX61265.1 hypothetical protein DAPPUDRAFT_70036 [Daphnia pulex]